MTEQAPRPHPFRRRLVVNTIATGAGNGWAMVVSLVSLPILVHGLGVTAFGLWIVLQTFSAITGWFSLADVGVGVAATRRVASLAATDQTDGLAITAATAMSVFVVAGIVWASLFGLIAPALLPQIFHAPHELTRDLQTASRLFAIQLLADLVTEGAEACLEGLQRVDLSRAIDAGRRTLVAVAVCVAALTTGSLVRVAAASLAASACGTAIALALLWVRVPEHNRRPRWSEAVVLLRYGRTVAVLRPLGVIQRTMDRVVVGVVLGPAAVAIVEVATQVLNGTDAVLSATSYAIFPGASWLDARDDRSTLRRLFLIGTKYSTFATWCTCALLIGVAGPFVRIWVGDKFSLAPELIAVALAGEMIAAPCQVGSQLLLGVGRASHILRAALAALIVNLVLSVTLVETIGTVGTFIGTLIANVVLVPLLLSSAFNLLGVRLAEFLRGTVLLAIPPVAAILLGAFTAAAIPTEPAIRLAVGVPAGLIAGGITAAFTTLNKHARQELRSALRSRS
jgi:O-antigen/teichoic acid export membrane protein